MDKPLVKRSLVPLIAVALSSCTPSPVDLIVMLGAGGEEAQLAKQELLIARENAVPALLAALDDPKFTVVRPELAEVLVGLTTRVDDDRIDSTLKRHMVHDSDPATRARIAREVGIRKLREYADAFVNAIADSVGEVRGEALTALAFMRRELNEDQLTVLAEKARLHQEDENFEARLGARIVVAERVNIWLRGAGNAVLRGHVAVAESLYREALTYAPHSSKANFKLGHYYFENGQAERGLQILRDSGWLLDVPLLPKAPVLDGRLDDDVWEGVVESTPFLMWSSRHDADIRPKVRTVIFAGYTPEALYIAARCEEAHPESLVVLDIEHDSVESAHQDLVEFFLDTNLDTDTYSKSVINSVRTVSRRMRHLA